MNLTKVGLINQSLWNSLEIYSKSQEKYPKHHKHQYK